MLSGPKQTQKQARDLRAAMSLPEVKLWQALRKRPSGLKFRRQHPAGVYVLDFYWSASKLAIEIDGEGHNRGDRPVRDGMRDAWLTSNGITVLRFPATSILADLEVVIVQIVATASTATPLHHASHGPPPLAEEDE
jgi:very-short-patch-repair endonuclease